MLLSPLPLRVWVPSLAGSCWCGTTRRGPGPGAACGRRSRRSATASSRGATARYALGPFSLGRGSALWGSDLWASADAGFVRARMLFFEVPFGSPCFVLVPLYDGLLMLAARSAMELLLRDPKVGWLRCSFRPSSSSADAAEGVLFLRALPAVPVRGCGVRCAAMKVHERTVENRARGLEMNRWGHGRDHKWCTVLCSCRTLCVPYSRKVLCAEGRCDFLLNCSARLPSLPCRRWIQAAFQWPTETGTTPEAPFASGAPPAETPSAVGAPSASEASSLGASDACSSGQPAAARDGQGAEEDSPVEGFASGLNIFAQECEPVVWERPPTRSRAPLPCLCSARGCMALAAANTVLAMLMPSHHRPAESASALWQS